MEKIEYRPVRNMAFNIVKNLTGALLIVGLAFGPLLYWFYKTT
jgi:hypothetical protein